MQAIHCSTFSNLSVASSVTPRKLAKLVSFPAWREIGGKKFHQPPLERRVPLAGLPVPNARRRFTPIGGEHSMFGDTIMPVISHIMNSSLFKFMLMAPKKKFMVNKLE